MSTGTSTLPPQALATGPAAINMLRQVGVAVGVSILVAVIGTPHAGPDALHAFRAGWTVIAVFGVLTALTAPLLLARVGRPTGKPRTQTVVTVNPAGTAKTVNNVDTSDTRDTARTINTTSTTGAVSTTGTAGAVEAMSTTHAVDAAGTE
jgi:hypothetical protein